MSHMKLFTRLGQTAAALLAALLLLGGLMPAFRPDGPPPEGPLRLRSGLPFKHSDEVLTEGSSVPCATTGGSFASALPKRRRSPGATGPIS